MVGTKSESVERGGFGGCLIGLYRLLVMDQWQVGVRDEGGTVGGQMNCKRGKWN